MKLSNEMLEIVPPMSNVIGISGNMIRQWAYRVAKLERVAAEARGYFLHASIPECPAALLSESRKNLNEALKELEE